MVFKHHNVEVSEAELAAVCQTDASGTTASNAVSAARYYGFEGTSTLRMDFEMLRQRVAEGLLPIVFIDFLPRIPPEAHALVVYEVLGEDADGRVYFVDPDKENGGYKDLTAGEFIRQWQNAKFRVIIVKK